MKRALIVGLALLFTTARVLHAEPQCAEWSPGFTALGVDGTVYALLSYDDGSGERLYVGGDFTAVGDVPARNLAVWDGANWSAVGEGPSAAVYALAFYDDGTGLELFAGGGGPGFPGMLERFDGSSWTAVAVSRRVNALHVFEDGSGPALFAGGSFFTVETISALGIARYDGSWSALPGARGEVRALATHDDGTGSKLYAAGAVSNDNDPLIDGIFAWDGVAAAPVGAAGVSPGDSGDEGAFALQSFGGDLYVGGRFAQAGGLDSQNWARWTPSGWEALPDSEIVRDFAVRTEADGTRSLFLADLAGVTRWDLSALLPVGTGLNGSLVLESYDSGAGAGVAGQLFVGHVGLPNRLLQLEAGEWTPVLPAGLAPGGTVSTLAAYDPGSSPRLLAGGRMFLSDQTEVEAVASFDGDAWTSVSANLTAQFVMALEAHDDGSGSELFATGYELAVDGVPSQVARFDGREWASLAVLPGIFSRGHDLTVFQDQLFVGGSFEGMAGVPGTRYVARWDGAGWRALGAGLEATSPGARVEKMVVYDDGSGEALYVGGRFALNGQVAVLARWDGVEWSDVGSGLTSESAFLLVNDLQVFQSPDGEVLVAVGSFDRAAGVLAAGVAAWDGQGWSSFAGGPEGEALLGRAVHAFDPDGNGEQLYVSLADSTGERFDVWDGESWAQPLVVEERIEGFFEFDGGEGRGLLTYGRFRSVDGVPSLGLARFADPCGADLGIPVCTARENSAGLRGRIRADGSSSVAAQDLTLSVRDLPSGASTLLFHGTAPRRIAFGDGLRCVGGAQQRIFPVGSATGGAYDLQVNFGAPYSAGYAAGATLLFQGWYRDAMGGPAGFNTTDALRLVFRP